MTDILHHEDGTGRKGSEKDVVLAMVNGSPPAPNFFYAVVAAGGIYAGESSESKISELVRQAKDGGFKLIVCSPGCESRVVSAAKQIGPYTGSGDYYGLDFTGFDFAKAVELRDNATFPNAMVSY